MTYAEKLKDPRWQKRRLEIFEAAGWKCVSCDENGKTLHVHHKRYVTGRDPWDYDDWDLECLCEECHERITEINKELRDSINHLTETDKIGVCGYIYARRLVDEYCNTGMETMVCVLQHHGPEWLEGFANFFGLNEHELYELQGDSVGEIPFSRLEAAWRDFNRRGSSTH